MSLKGMIEICTVKDGSYKAVTIEIHRMLASPDRPMKIFGNDGKLRLMKYSRHRLSRMV